MARVDTSRRLLLATSLKSVVVTAAIVGTLGGWAAFGAQQTTTTIADVPAVAQVADASGTNALSEAQSESQSTTSQSSSSSSQSTVSQVPTPQPSTGQSITSQPSTGSQSTFQRRAITSTRSSR